MITPLSLQNINRVLCLGAHADDIEIGCGGTMLKLQQCNPGLVVDWVVFSSEPPRDQEASRCAAEFLATAGEHEVQIKQFPDRYFPDAWSDIKDFFGDLARQLSGDRKPDLVFTHRRDDRHQDHRVIAELTWNAFRDHLILEYEIPKYEGDLGQPNVFVPLDQNLVECKNRLIIECFASQRCHHWFDDESFRSLMRLRGIESNAKERYAEAFYGQKLVLL